MEIKSSGRLNQCARCVLNPDYCHLCLEAYEVGFREGQTTMMEHFFGKMEVDKVEAK